MRTFLREIGITLILALIVLFLLQTTVQIRPVLGSCMEDSLQREGQRLLINKVVYHFHEPERGDIIIFHPPNELESADPFIKRIIGLPGEIIEVKDGIVYVDGSPLYEPYVKSPPHYTVPEYKVPENEYFVLGDNRPVANDSHNGWTVPRQDIIGKAWLSIWPPDKWGLAPNYSLPE